MAMNGNNMGDEILTAMSGVSDTDRQALFRAMANAIVSHIQTNAGINLNIVFSQGVPVPNDGGAALQNVWKVLGSQIGLIT